MRARRLHIDLFLGTALAGLAAAAPADPLSISSASTTAVRTSAAANGSAGDVTVTSDGSLNVASGTAVTVDSSNALSNAGTIQASGVSGATAVLIDGAGPITTSITNTGTIETTGTGGSGNYGVRAIGGAVSGTLAAGATTGTISVIGDNSYGVSIETPWTGNIAARSVSVTGANSTAVSLTAPLTGNLTLTGANVATGGGDTGLFVGSTVTGTVNNSGGISAGLPQGTDSNGNTIQPLTGQGAAWIAGSVGGGFVNDRFYTDSTGATVPSGSVDTSKDTLIDGTLTGIAGTVALRVQPGGAAPANVALGLVGAAGSDDGYAIVNRGSIVTTNPLIGVDTTAIEISGATIGGTSYGVTLAGGFVSQATGSITVSSTDAAATAIHIGAGASVPAIVNEGTIAAAAKASADTLGGAAYGIVIGAGSAVPTIVNSGTIGATAGGNGHAAYGVIDEGGGVASVQNSGAISAIAGTGGIARAIDLSAGTGAQTVANSGTIQGDIAFGNGGGTYASASGTLQGTLLYGSGANQLALSGTTGFASPITIASGGTLGVTMGDTATLSFRQPPPTLSSLSMSGSSNLILPVGGGSSALAVTGQASFTGSSRITLDILSAPVGAVSVLHAAGGITTDHAASLVATAAVPYIYALDSAQVTADDVLVTLRQKSGIEAGFTPTLAPLFDQSLVALSAAGGAEFQAIANLPDQASVRAAYRQIEPLRFGSAVARMTQLSGDSASALVSGRVDALLAMPGKPDPDVGHTGFWGQQVAQRFSHSDSMDDPGFHGDLFGFALGADRRLGSGLVVGMLGTVMWSDAKVSGVAAKSDPLRQATQLIDFYAGWRRGPWFAEVDVQGGHDSFRTTDDLAIGSFTATKTGRWTGYRYGGNASLGARFALGRFWIQPSDTASYTHVSEGKYDEMGGGDFDLAVGSQRITLASDTPKLEIGYGMPMGDGRIVIHGEGGYMLQLHRNLPALEAVFLAGGAPFSLATDPLGSHALIAGGGVGYDGSGWHLSVDLAHRHESQLNADSVGATLRVSF